MRGKTDSYIIHMLAISRLHAQHELFPRFIDTHWLVGSIQTPAPISQLLNSASSSAVLDSMSLSLRRGGSRVGGVVKVAPFPWRRVNSCTRLLTSTRCLNISEGRTLTQCTSCCHGSETLCTQSKYGATSVQKAEGK